MPRHAHAHKPRGGAVTERPMAAERRTSDLDTIALAAHVRAVRGGVRVQHVVHRVVRRVVRRVVAGEVSEVGREEEEVAFRGRLGELEAAAGGRGGRRGGGG